VEKLTDTVITFIIIIIIIIIIIMVYSCENLDEIRIQWPAFLNTVMDFILIKNYGHFVQLN